MDGDRNKGRMWRRERRDADVTRAPVANVTIVDMCAKHI